MNNLQRALKNYREKHDLKQIDLAKKLGVTRETLANWESGRAMPRSDMFSEIANILDLSIDYLLNRENDSHITTPQPTMKDNDFWIALKGEVNGLSPELRKTVLDYAKFIKSQEEKK